MLSSYDKINRMIRIFSFIFVFLLQLQLVGEVVLVSIAPYKYMVEAIAGDTITVEVLVPASADMHTFEPTVKQTQMISRADLWFRIGENFERQLLEALQAYRPNLRIIDLREGQDLIMQGCCRHHQGADLHFWLSPKMLKNQAKRVAAILGEAYPQNIALYQQNLSAHLERLDRLDQEVDQRLAPLKNRILIVSHPAYGYLAREYGFKQASIETEGREPSPRELTRLMQLVSEVKPRYIYTQVQFNNKVSELIASRFNAKVVYLDPHAENYIDAILMIVSQFALSAAP